MAGLCSTDVIDQIRKHDGNCKPAWPRISSRQLIALRAGRRYDTALLSVAELDVRRVLNRIDSGGSGDVARIPLRNTGSYRQSGLACNADVFTVSVSLESK